MGSRPVYATLPLFRIHWQLSNHPGLVRHGVDPQTVVLGAPPFISHGLPRMPAHHPWTTQDITLALAAKGWSLRRLAAEVGLSPSGASYALKSGSNLIFRAKVEEILQTSWTTLWPDRCPPQWRDCGPP